MLKPASRVPADAYEAVFSALAHPARRRVLLTIFFHGGQMTAGEIAGIFEHAWQTTTRHLRVLEKASLLSHERQGRMQMYRIERKRLALVREWLAHFQQEKKTNAGGKKHVPKEKAGEEGAASKGRATG